MTKPVISIIMGSKSDWATMQKAAEVLDNFGVAYEKKVIGVPVKSRALSGVDSLYSIVQMPGGVPVATMAIGEAGATNAALFALRLLSVDDKAIADALANFAEEQGKIAEESTNELN